MGERGVNIAESDMRLNNLTDDELLRYAMGRDDLTELEKTLISRLYALLNELDEFREENEELRKLLGE